MTQLAELLDQYADTEELWIDWHVAVSEAVSNLSGENMSLTTDQCWTLVSWAEDSASAAVRFGDQALLVTGLQALAAVEREGKIDRRDLWIVTDVIHRAAELTGATDVEMPPTSTVAERFLSRKLGGRLELHSEPPVDENFQFVRRDTGIDVDHLLERFGAEHENE